MDQITFGPRSFFTLFVHALQTLIPVSRSYIFIILTFVFPPLITFTSFIPAKTFANGCILCYIDEN